MAKYIPTIGVETHVQLKTATKLFSAVGNDASQAGPNTLISHIDVGMPGALPVLNARAIELASRAAFALNTKPEKFSKFDRKHYFYPDLPKGYQITQYEDPIIKGGHVDIEVDGKKIQAGITRVHLEEDAGKNIHPAGADYTLVDLNRAGTPLLEIVGEPDLHSPAEAKAYVRELYLLMKYADVSDCDLYLGHMRFDVNVSISTDPTKPGVRSEIKNLNSFRSVENAIAYEIKRQTEVLEKGGKNIQETRGWDEAKQKTTSQRSKEEAEDYRYMPEPDLPPVELSDTQIGEYKKNLPMLPGEIRDKLRTLDITEDVIEDALDRPRVTEVVLKHLQNAGPRSARRSLFLLLHTVSSEDGTDLIRLEPDRLSQLAEMVENKQISANTARTVLGKMIFTNQSPLEIAKEMGKIQISDRAQLEKIVAEVVADNPKVVADIKAGQEKAIGFLVGQVMAKSKGQANPQVAQKLIKKALQ